MSRLSPAQFVQQSLDLHLFFLRSCKEHSFFLGSRFFAKMRISSSGLTNSGWIRKALEIAVDLQLQCQQTGSEVGEVVTITPTGGERTEFRPGSRLT